LAILFTYAIVFIGGTAFLIPSPGYAEIPETIGFQGRVNERGGPPFEGIVNMTINIYAERVGGVALFTESHPSVDVVKGKFFVELGSVDPAGNPLSALDFDNKYWLGVTIGGDSEMTPRIRFNSVAYARRAAAAARADESGKAANADQATFASELSRDSLRIVKKSISRDVGNWLSATISIDCAVDEIPINGWAGADFDATLPLPDPNIRLIRTWPTRMWFPFNQTRWHFYFLIDPMQPAPAPRIFNAWALCLKVSDE
jgi:hypothetical protein